MIRVLKLPDSLLRRTERGGALKLVLVSRVATRFALAIQEALSFPDPTKREKKKSDKICCGFGTAGLGQGLNSEVEEAGPRSYH
jgi:hypothetical protein